MYFQLLEDRLCYYSCEEDMKTLKLGVIEYLPLDQIQIRPIPHGYKPMVGVAMVPGILLASPKGFENCCFSIQCGGGTHYMAADTEKEAKNWVEAIIEACYFYINTSERTTLFSNYTNASMPMEGFDVVVRRWMQMDEACIDPRATVPIVTVPIVTKKLLTLESGVQCGKNCALDENSLFLSQKSNLNNIKETSQKQICQVLEHLEILRSAQELQHQILVEEEKMHVQEFEIETLKELDEEKSKDIIIQRELYRVEVYTGSIDGLDLQAKMLIQFQGSLGNSENISLMQTLKPNSLHLFKCFEKNGVDNFEIHMKSIGDLERLQIIHIENTKPLWYPTHVIVYVGKNKEGTCFLPMDWKSDFPLSSNYVMDLYQGKFVMLKTCLYVIVIRTSNLKGAGTFGIVHLMLRGDNKEFVDLTLKTSNTHFKRNSVDTFMVETKDFKTLNEIKVAIEGPQNSESKWHLEQVEIVKEGTNGTKVYFPCDDWILGSQQGDLHWQILFASFEDPRSNIKNYLVTVYTGNLKGAGTDANIYISVFGNQRSTGEICLPSNPNSFEVGAIDKFLFKWKDLGKITTLNVRVDNQELTSNWYLDFIEILEESSHVYTYFSCEQWFSNDKELGALSWEFKNTLYNPLQLKKNKYKVTFYTSDIRNAGTDATVYIEIFGALGRSSKKILRASRDAFSRAKIDEFFIECPELGCLTKIIVGHDNKGPHPGWHLHLVEVTICQTEEIVYFPCGTWLDCTREDQCIFKELLAIFSNPYEELHTYLVYVKTGNYKSAGTNANIKINIYGKKKESGYYLLENGSPHVFERGCFDMFTMKFPYLGVLCKLEVCLDNMGHSSNWFLDKIEVVEDSTGIKWFFPCYQWFDHQLENIEIVKVLEAHSQLPIEENTCIYKVTIITSNIKGASTSANVTMQLIGVKNSSEVIKLESRDTNFDRGTTNEFVFDCKDVGDILKIIIGHDNSGWSPGWHLDYVNVKVEAIQKEWHFYCQQWLDSSIGDKAINRELIPENKRMDLEKTKFKITTFTSNIKGAGTDANVSICLYGQKTFTHPILLSSSLHDFERGRVDEFWTYTEDLGTIKWIEIGHDNTSENPSWHLHKVLVKNVNTDSTWNFLVNQWFDINIGDGLIRRNLWSEIPNLPINMQHYKILMYTSDLKGAGTDANILVQLIGDKGISELKKIIPTVDTFERGKCDEFIVDTFNIGTLVKLKVGHDNSSLNPVWHLDRIEVIEETINTSWIFVFNDWIYVDHHEEFSIVNLDPLSSSDLKATRVNFCIIVYTGDCRGATSNADVSIVIYGDVRNSKLQKLRGKNNKDVFERGQADTFYLSLPFLGDLKELQVQLDGSKIGKGWFLDFIEVAEVNNMDGISEDQLEKNIKKRWYFSCEQWLAVDKEDGLTTRTLIASCNDPRDLRSTYLITIFTSDIKGAGIDANVFIVLHGNNSSSSQQKLFASYNSFERGAIDTFTLKLHDLGELTKIIIGHDCSGYNPEWHLAQVVIKKIDFINKHWKFLCQKWLKDSNEHGDCICELQPIDSSIPICQYFFKIHTSLIEGKIVDHSISIEIIGKNKSTRALILEGPQEKNDKSKLHMFCKMAEDVSPILKTRLKVQTNAYKNDAWKLQMIEVSKEGSTEIWYFHVKKWIGLGSITNIELLIDASHTQHEQGLVPYEINLYDLERNLLNHNKEFYIKIIGEQLTVGPERLEHVPSCLQKLEQKKFIFLFFPPIGKLQKIIIGLTNNAKLDNHCHLGTIEIIDMQLVKKYRFVCEEWIGRENFDNKMVEIEIPLCCKPLKCTYQLTTYTEELRGKKIMFSIVMYGNKQNSKTHIFEIKKSFLNNDKAQKEIFNVEDDELGELLKIHIALTDGSYERGWFLGGVQIDIFESGSNIYFPCNKWLDAHFGNGETSVDLYPGLVDADAIPRVEYRIRFYTSNLKKAGTNANVAFILFGELHRSAEQRIRNHRHHLFRRHSITEVIIQCEDLGSLKKLRIWHESTDLNPSWHLSHATVMNLETIEEWNFPCEQCFIKQHDRRIVYKELIAQSVQQEMFKKSALSSMTRYSKDDSLVAMRDRPLQYCSEMTYKLTIMTGKRPFAGTNAQVYFTLFGDLGNTRRSSFVQNHNHFSRGSEDIFLMTVLNLGAIKVLRVGHNGQGLFPGWYLKHVDVQNTNTREKWHFECGDWISPPSTRVAITNGGNPVFSCFCISPWKESRLERDYFPKPG